MTEPKQLLVRATTARNNVKVLAHGTSLLDIRSSVPESDQDIVKNGLRMLLPAIQHSTLGLVNNERQLRNMCREVAQLNVPHLPI
jgi:hypothetical protein